MRKSKTMLTIRHRGVLVCAAVVMALVSSATGRGQGPSEENYEPVGLQPGRGYFGQLPFERVDMINGNLLFSFTDLALPGDGGMDLRIVRAYNHQAPALKWTFGIAGVPSLVQNPNGPLPNDSDGTPILVTAGGGSVQATSPANSVFNDTVFLASDFTRYTPATRTVELPNGWVATYESGNEPGGSMLLEVHDPFGNSITPEWEPGSIRPLRLLAVNQSVGGASRRVEFTYSTESNRMPETMRLVGGGAGGGDRVWEYDYGTQVPGTSAYMLTEMRPPAGGAWQFGYTYSGLAGTVSVTLPNGGTVGYNFDAIRLPSYAEVDRSVITDRTTGGRDVPAGTWDFEFGQAGEASGLVEMPDGRTVEFEQEFDVFGARFGPDWVLSKKTITDGSATASVEREYVSLPVTFAATIKVVKKETISQDGRDYVTTYSYGTDNFSDYDRPSQIEEVGERTRTTQRTYQHLQSPYLKGLLSSEAVTVSGRTVSSSSTYDTNTGFKTSQTVGGRTTQYSASGSGNVASVTDANGHTTSQQYQWGVVQEVVTPEYTVTRTVRLDGAVTSETRNGATVTFGYDDLGRQTSLDPAEGAETVTSYFTDRIDVVRDGETSSTEIDGFGRPTETETAEGVRVRFEYDVDGRKKFESDPFLGSTGGGREFTYDFLGRLTRVDFADGTAVVRSYSGGKVVITNQRGHNAEHHLASFGNPAESVLVGLKDEEGHDWGYEYDVFGNLTRVAPPSGPDRTWHYDDAGNLDSESHPESGTVTYLHDAVGNVREKVDAEGQRFVYTYDDVNRLVGTDAPDDFYDVVVDYDDADNRKLVVTGDATASFDYDSANRLRKRTDQIGGRTFVTEFEYDNSDNLVALTYPSGRVVRYTNDGDGRPVAAFETGGPTYATGLSYHASGLIDGMVFGNGLLEDVDEHPQSRRPTRIQSGPVDITYTYDNVGNVKTVADPRNGGEFNAAYDYDNLDRLTSVTGYGAMSFSYDALGNRSVKNYGLAGAVNYTYDSQTQRLTSSAGPAETTSFSYDDNGNMLADGTGTYAYTPWNMLARSTVNGIDTVYGYDGDGIRVRKAGPSGVRLYIHGPGGQILAEYEDTGSTATVVREYVYLGSRLLASIGAETEPTPPLAVVVTSPAPGERFPSDEDITLTASVTHAPSAIARVEFYQSGLLLGSATAAPYSVTWPLVPAGSYTVQARVVLADGTAAPSSSVPVVVYPVGRVFGVTVSPSSPNEGEPVTVTVTGNSHPCGAVEIDYGVGTPTVFPREGPLPFTAPVSHAWVEGGTYTVRATGHGDCRNSATVEVAVIGNLAPTVNLTAPTASASFAAPATVQLEANAADSDGTIDRVEFYADSTLVGTATTAPYTYTWSNVGFGHYTLTARAFDNAGKSTISSGIAIDVVHLSGLTSSLSTVVVGQPVTLTLAGDSSCSAVQFDYGDGTVETYPLSGLPITRTHQWATGGTKSIVATGQGNCTGVVSTTVTVEANTGPSVAMSNPAPGVYQVGASIALTATASDADGVSQVEFLVNGVVVDADSSAPYSTSWTVTAGSASLSARATDSYGAVSTSAPVVVNGHHVTGVSTSPSTVVTGQASTITVTGSATCGAVTLDFGDGTSETYAIANLPFSVARTWATGGTKTVTASGQSTCLGSAGTTIAVSANTPPSASLTSPAAGTYEVGTTVALAASASDGDGIALVEFLAGSTAVGSDASAPYSVNWTVPAGTTSVAVRATDVFGAVTTSSAVTITGVHVMGVSVSPAGVVTGQSATITVTGSAACEAVTINFGDGTYQTYPLGGLPHSVTKAWSSAGAKTITAVGESTCTGTASTGASVSANAGPSVALESPAGGTYQVGASVTLAASASDSHGVAMVEFLAGSTVVGTDSAAPFTMTWSVPPGVASISARATDVYGAVSTSSAVSVTGIHVMGVSVSPAGVVTGQSATITVTGSAACEAVTINFGDGTYQTYPLSGLPHSVTKAWSSAGAKTITAVGESSCTGTASTSASVSANAGPSVALASPAAGTYQVGASLTLTANASDSHGVAMVEFLAGSTVVGTDSSAPFTMAWSVPAGTTSISARATDVYGAVSTSSAVSVTGHHVMSVSVSPANVVVGQSATITVSGSSACGAVTINFGDGTAQTYALSGLPHSVSRTWSTAATRTITASGDSTCIGTATTTVAVSTNPAPSVSIGSPSSGSAHVTAVPLTVSASASDSHGISAVHFYAGGTHIGSAYSAPYSITWGSPTSGTHSLTAVAVDGYGASATSSAVSVTMRDVTTVAVSPGAITAGQSATVTVYGSTACGAVTIDYGDGTAITHAISGLPFSVGHTWTTGGTKTITATGQSTCQGSASTSLAVNAPPSVSLTSPVSGNVFYTPATVTLSASASDADGSVASVQFYANGSVLTTDSSAPFTYTWSSVGVGSYSITAVATDNQGATTTSSAVGISVQQPAPSTIVSVSVSPASPAAGQWATVYVNGADPCGAAGIDYGDGESIFYPLDGIPFSKSHAWSSPGTYTITVTGHGNCSGSVSTTITVTGAAEPREEAEFVNYAFAAPVFGEALEGESEDVAQMPDGSGELLPAYNEPAWSLAPLQTQTLTLDLAGSGTGSVVSDPSGISCVGAAQTCSASFADSTVVTLTATPDTGQAFTGWSGACSGTAACTVTLSSAQYVAAHFRLIPPIVTTYYHLDSLGSVRAVTDASGATLRREDYFVFGEGGTPPAGDPLRFTGKMRDSETALDYFGARYYRNTTGRFTSVDPLLGEKTALTDPQRWNRYSYVGNRPLRLIDPDGRGWASKLFKLVVKGGDVAATFADVIDNAQVLIDGNSSLGEKAWAAASIASEALPLSVGDVKGVASVAAKYGDQANVVSNVIDSNKLRHLFDNPEHKLDGLVKAIGSREDAYRAILERVGTAHRLGKVNADPKGIYSVVVDVDGMMITVTGKIVDGVARIGTAYIQ